MRQLSGLTKPKPCKKPSWNASLNYLQPLQQAVGSPSFSWFLPHGSWTAGAAERSAATTTRRVRGLDMAWMARGGDRWGRFVLKKMFSLMILCELFKIDICWCFWIFVLFLRLCRLVLFIQLRLSNLHDIRVEIWSDWEDELNSRRISQNVQNHGGRQTSSCSEHFSIDMHPPVFGTTGQSVKSGNLFLSKKL